MTGAFFSAIAMKNIMPWLLKGIRSKKTRGGTTLIEIVISSLILGLACAAVMPVFLTSSISVARVDRRQAAVDSIRRLTEELKGYVAADRSSITGPGAGSSGWDLPGDKSGKWALEGGRHELDPKMWCAFLADCGGTMSYTVTVRATPSGPQPDVSVTVDWDGSK